MFTVVQVIPWKGNKSQCGGPRLFIPKADVERFTGVKPFGRAVLSLRSTATYLFANWAATTTGAPFATKDSGADGCVDAHAAPPRNVAVAAPVLPLPQTCFVSVVELCDNSVLKHLLQQHQDELVRDGRVDIVAAANNQFFEVVAATGIAATGAEITGDDFIFRRPYLCTVLGVVEKYALPRAERLRLLVRSVRPLGSETCLFRQTSSEQGLVGHEISGHTAVSKASNVELPQASASVADARRIASAEAAAAAGCDWGSRFAGRFAHRGAQFMQYAWVQGNFVELEWVVVGVEKAFAHSAVDNFELPAVVAPETRFEIASCSEPSAARLFELDFPPKQKASNCGLVADTTSACAASRSTEGQAGAMEAASQLPSSRISTTFVPALPEDGRSRRGFAKVCGLKELKAELCRLIQLPRVLASRLASLGIDRPRGVLLHGPEGTGKSFLCRAFLEELETSVQQGYSFKEITLVNPEAELAVALQSACATPNAVDLPLVLFFDDAELLFGSEVDGASKRKMDSSNSFSASRSFPDSFASRLLSLLGSAPPGCVVLLATARDPNALCAGFRSLLTYEVEVPLPNVEERISLLRHFLSRSGTRMADEKTVRELANECQAFSAVDLKKVVECAVLDKFTLVTAPKAPAVLASLAEAAESASEFVEATPHECVAPRDVFRPIGPATASLESGPLIAPQPALTHLASKAAPENSIACEEAPPSGSTPGCFPLKAADTCAPADSCAPADTCAPAELWGGNAGAWHPSLEGLVFSDFSHALRTIQPSGMRGFEAVEIPHVSWEDVGGYACAKQQLQECVEWPVTHRELFQRMRLRPPAGVLLYGPPGCSKTLLAKAVATRSKMNFIAVKGPELFSKFVGDSEAAVRATFRRARQNAPCIVFFDEVDSLGADRSRSEDGVGVEARVLSQLLNEIDGIAALSQVLVIGATNRPDLLDAALLRPGRLDRHVYIPLPDQEARRAILQVHLRSYQIRRREALIKDIAARTDRYSGAELAMVCREAAFRALRRFIEEPQTKPLQGELLERHEQKAALSDAPGKKADVKSLPNIFLEDVDFESSLRAIKPRISKELIEFYEQYSQQHA